MFCLFALIGLLSIVASILLYISEGEGGAGYQTAGCICLGLAYVFVTLVYTIYILKFWIVAVKVDFLKSQKSSANRLECIIKLATYTCVTLCLLGGIIYSLLMDDQLDYHFNHHTIDPLTRFALTLVSVTQGLILITLYIHAMCLFSKLKKNERSFSTFSNLINLVLIVFAVIGSALMTSLVYQSEKSLIWGNTAGFFLVQLALFMILERLNFIAGM
jgi:hypothetical protein